MQMIRMAEALGDQGTRALMIARMRAGDVFLYPTDTVYGIGCDAGNAESVRRIAEAKGRAERSFSVIAPSKEWIWANALFSEANRKLADALLPGPYTIVARAGKGVPKEVVSPERTIGIRIPKHPFASLVTEAGVPFVTTSANASGRQPATTPGAVPEQIRKAVDWAIDAGEIGGASSRVFDLTKDDVRILRH